MSDWCPEGYAALPEIGKLIFENRDAWRIRTLRDARPSELGKQMKGGWGKPGSAVKDTIVPLLVNGKAQAMAVLDASGEIVVVPAHVWSAKPADIFQSSMWDAAVGSGLFEEFRVPVKGQNMAARPVMALSELARILGAEVPPPPPPTLPAGQAPASASDAASKAVAARWWTLGYATCAASADRKAKRNDTVRLCREATGATDAEAKAAFTALPGELKNHDRSGRDDDA